jgi:hypothetical protein
VLSTNTGFQRNYSEDPYADYNGNDDLFFPLSKRSNKFANKDMIYAVKLKNETVAFYWKDLLKYQFASISTSEGTVNVAVKKFITTAVIKDILVQLVCYKRR